MILAVVAVLPFLVKADVNNCFMCATRDLQSRWQLTGLPPMFSSNEYFLQCSGNTKDFNSIKKEPCPGACFVMMFEDPDPTDSDTPSLLYVRGCHSTLVQVTTNRSNSNGGYCELDNTYPMADSSGNPRRVKMLMEFCTGNECNSRTKFTEPVCTQQNTDLFNNQPIQCYECTPKQGSNCKESKCTKKYCMKQTIKLGGSYQLTKSCSNVNIAGVDNYCMSNEVISTPGGVAVKNRYDLCYCKNKQFCNLSPVHVPLLSTIFFIFSAMYI